MDLLGACKKNRFLLLLFCLTILFIGTPLSERLPFYRTLASGVFYSVALLGVYFAQGKGIRLNIVSLLSLISFISGVLLFKFRGTPLIYFYTFFNLFTVLLTCLFILGFVFKRGSVDNEKIFAAICVYLMIGLLFGFSYLAIEITLPGSFHLAEPLRQASLAPFKKEAIIPPFTYFSFTTLTTLGYGDMTPLRPLALNLTSIEAVIGQLYLTVLIARLLGLQIAEARGK